jgi:hypothetical protein
MATQSHDPVENTSHLDVAIILAILKLQVLHSSRSIVT